MDADIGAGDDHLNGDSFGSARLDSKRQYFVFIVCAGDSGSVHK